MGSIYGRARARGDNTDRICSGLLVRMPFRLFPRQFELIDFFNSCLEFETNGLVEKSRDMGATWAAISYAVWLFLFKPGSSVGFGSRKAQLVDRIGDMDSIFEKMRHCITSLPPLFRPHDYDASYMKLFNHDNGASITGESGDEIGRGGRKGRVILLMKRRTSSTRK